MGRITKIDSLEKAWKVVDYQTSAQDLLNERLYLKTTGWSKVQLTDEFKRQLCDMLTRGIGGHHKTKEKIERCLLFRSPQHWALKRFFLTKYGKEARISYYAGQDHVSEMRDLRNFLYNEY